MTTVFSSIASDTARTSELGTSFASTGIRQHHIFKHDDKTYLFVVELLRAFLINTQTAEELSRIVSLTRPLQVDEAILLDSFQLIVDNTSPVNQQTLSSLSCVHTLVLNVIQSCNLRCNYCFAGDGSYGDSGKMEKNLAIKALDWFFGQLTKQRGDINFFGGEPLANFQLIVDCVSYAKSLSIKNKKDIFFSMTTNGTLITNEIAKFLSENNFRVAVSIDGPEVIHDRNRRYANGKGSFNRVVDGIRLLQQHEVEIIARCTLYGSYENDIDEIRNFLCDLGVNEIFVAKASPPEKPIVLHGINFRKNSSYANPPLLSATINNALAELKEAVEAKSRGIHISNSVVKLAEQIESGQPRKYACGVGKNITAVGIDGNFYACHRFTNNSEWKVGSVNSGISEQERFFDKDVEEIPACSECWARHLCGGGCRHDNWTHSGDPFKPESDFCVEMRTYAEKAIVLYVSNLNERRI